MARAERPTADAIVLRSAREDERSALAELGHHAYRVSSDATSWQRYYHEHSHFGPADVVVAECEGAVAGSAALLRFTMSLCGLDVPMCGVAAVGVAPEFRRRGIADHLMREVLGRSRARGDALSLLYPFRLSYYRRFGYALCETTEHLRVTPSQLPTSRLARRVRRYQPIRDNQEVRAVYEAARAGTTGQLVRSDYWWDPRIPRHAPEGAVYTDESGRMTGYLLYNVTPAPTTPGALLHARELRALTPDAHLGLYGFLAGLGDQYRLVELVLPPGSAALLLGDHGAVDCPLPLVDKNLAGYLGSGAMSRLLDVARAFALHPGPRQNGASGRVGLELTDPVFADQNGSFDVHFGARGARVRPGAMATDRIAISVEHLAQIYFGAVPARTLLSHGYATGSERAAALLDAAFRGPPLHFGLLNAF